MKIESNSSIKIFQEHNLPVVKKDIAFKEIKEPLIDQAIRSAGEIKKFQSQLVDMGWEGKGKIYCDLIAPKMGELRSIVDQLEMVVDNAMWPLPKYRELLFLI